MKKNYTQEYQISLSNPELFWQQQSQTIHWFQKPKKILSQDAFQNFRWFENGELNTCYLALDHHVINGNGEHTALIYDSPVTNKIEKYTYNQLLNETSLFAGALKNLGVTKGDRVVIYMPMIPQAVIAMLACARLGAIHSVVFGGFAPHELALRIDDAEPKVLITASCGIELTTIIPYKPLVDRAIIESQYKPSHTVVFQRPQCKADIVNKTNTLEHDWSELISQASPTEPITTQSWDPLYILYTSGTTGKPKGIVRDCGGHAVAMKYSMKEIFNMQPNDVFWAASDVGWVVGHSYIVYGPLIQGCQTLLYEGKPIKTPDAGAFWRVIETHQVKTLFCAPTALRAIRKEDPNGIYLTQYNTQSLQTLFVAGERLDTSTYEWAQKKLSIPVVDNWWQTETGWPISANMMGLEPITTKPGSATRPVCGFDVQILDDDGHCLPHGKEGSVAIKLPLPPGCLPTLWNDQKRFEAGYLTKYPGFYVSGDGGVFDQDGYLYLLGRIDDVINVAGHRLSTAEMEELITQNIFVAETAVFGINDDIKGQVPMALVVLKEKVHISEVELEQQLSQVVREQIGSIASFKIALIVKRLPKTRSGKILRATLRKIVNGENYTLPSTIEDPNVINEICLELKRRNLIHSIIAS